MNEKEFFGLSAENMAEIIKAGWVFMCNAAPLNGLARIAAENCTLKSLRREGGKDIISLRASKAEEYIYNSTILGAMRKAFEDLSGQEIEIMIGFED